MIETEEEYKLAIVQFEELLDKIEEYENKNHPIEAPNMLDKIMFTIDIYRDNFSWFMLGFFMCFLFTLLTKIYKVL